MSIHGHRMLRRRAVLAICCVLFAIVAAADGAVPVRPPVEGTAAPAPATTATPSTPVPRSATPDGATPSPSTAAPSPRRNTSPPAPTSPDPGGDVPLQLAGYWWADQSDVPLGSAGCGPSSATATAEALTEEWDYWDTCGSSAVSVAREGLPPTPWLGDRVIRITKPRGSDLTTQKLNRTLTADNWPGGRGSANTGSPADVSARYVVYQYIPSARLHLNPGHGWVILHGFKENYRDAAGQFHQDPTWTVGCNNFTGPVRCSLMPHTSTFPLAPYLDRWVKWEYRLYQGADDRTGNGGRVELYADDRLVDVGYDTEMHVGSGAFAPLDRSLAFVWIAGQYTSPQITDGVPDYVNTAVTSYLGLSTILPLP